MRCIALTVIALGLSSCKPQDEGAQSKHSRPGKLEVILENMPDGDYMNPYLIVRNKTKYYVCIPDWELMAEYQTMDFQQKGEPLRQIYWAHPDPLPMENVVYFRYSYVIIPPGEDFQIPFDTSVFALPAEGAVDWEFVASGYDCRDAITSPPRDGMAKAREYLLYGKGTISFDRLRPPPRTR